MLVCVVTYGRPVMRAGENWKDETLDGAEFALPMSWVGEGGPPAHGQLTLSFLSDATVAVMNSDAVNLRVQQVCMPSHRSCSDGYTRPDHQTNVYAKYARIPSFVLTMVDGFGFRK